jgi:hypothetical protein
LLQAWLGFRRRRGRLQPRRCWKLRLQGALRLVLWGRVPSLLLLLLLLCWPPLL